MLNALLPAQINNVFSGHRIALYVFFALTALALWRSQHHLLAHDGGAQSIASIPLDSYGVGAAGTIVGVFSLWGLSQLVIALIYLLAAIRYRAMIPLLYVLFTLEYVVRILIGEFRTIETAGTAPGAVANIPFALLGLAMLALCLWPARNRSATR